MRAGVQQIFAFEINARPAEFFGEAGSKLQRGWPAGEILQQILEAGLKRGIRLRGIISALQFE